ncbi:DUF7673 family protein [Ramlibacter pallidus]|uniref:DUF7673 domain-containing protein n=1 Tax=Ramlibacter pallidus TaxID=2780087 RepID=A0ABR9S8Q2_9BURK|nr:hypothetical protein [Ramlibacter pallidus]MBE7369652.1 hypothetical protein [Ramlibacter pallidus]
MNQAERERRHQANLERIARVQVVTGRADKSRIDHEGTLFERARLMEEELRSHRATELGLAAFDRLLRTAEERSSPQARDIVAFVGAVWNNRPLPLLTLRGSDSDAGDDMLAVLDAFRYARLNLVENVRGGPRRVGRLLQQWKLASA